MELILMGATHHTAGPDLRARLALDAGRVRQVLDRVRADGVLLEAAILSTCNRTEYYGLASSSVEGRDYWRQLIAAESGADITGAPGGGLVLEGEPAALHLHRVAAGLDSMMVGEPQIMGQVRDAHVIGRGAGTIGAVLDRLWSSALHAGKRARAESGIATGAVSVASAAVSLAERVVGDLRDRDVVVVGAGDTGHLAARHFSERGAGRLTVVNRGRERAAAVAAAFDARAAGLDDLPALLRAADVVVSATSAPAWVITASMVRPAIAARPDRPLVLVDIAVPPDIEPAAADDDSVFLYPLDALQSVVDQALEKRRRELPRAEAIVRDEADRFSSWARGRGAVPLVRDLRDHFERVRAEEVSRSLRHFSEADQAHVERLTRSLINRLLRVPTTRLKTLDASSEDGAQSLAAVREVFALDEPPSREEMSHES